MKLITCTGGMEWILICPRGPNLKIISRHGGHKCN